ncbi:hypothetical protein PIB30_091987 [Stylosanthes scabra]|uniref:Uncharacterized protein n=1 Tax=Stylosanthes scabra TaxID=79078 RepID=A0ABU6QVR4_9FABA|nr:hypothetical protein [Stylosanthes scabra]
MAANPQPVTPPASQKASNPKGSTQSFKRRSQRIAAIGRTFFQPPKKQEAITISSDPEPEPEKVEEAEDVEEDPEEDPVETPQGAGIKEDDKENPEEDPMEENAAEEGVRVEDDFTDYRALVRSDSENRVGNDYRFTGNVAPANSPVGFINQIKARIFLPPNCIVYHTKRRTRNHVGYSNGILHPPNLLCPLRVKTLLTFAFIN